MLSLLSSTVRHVHCALLLLSLWCPLTFLNFVAENPSSSIRNNHRGLLCIIHGLFPDIHLTEVQLQERNCCQLCLQHTDMPEQHRSSSFFSLSTGEQTVLHLYSENRAPLPCHATYLLISPQHEEWPSCYSVPEWPKNGLTSDTAACTTLCACVWRLWVLSSRGAVTNELFHHSCTGTLYKQRWRWKGKKNEKRGTYADKWLVGIMTPVRVLVFLQKTLDKPQHLVVQLWVSAVYFSIPALSSLCTACAWLC